MNKKIFISILLLFIGVYTISAAPKKRTTKPVVAKVIPDGWQKGPGFGKSILFNDSWLFHYGDMPKAKEYDYNDSKWRKLDLPHDWSIEMPASPYLASCTGFLPGGIGWYRKQFTVDKAQKGKPVYIYFEGVYNNSEVWINGKYLGKRPNGYISFMYDLTPYINYGGNNVVSVRVDHEDYADSRWYTGSGIYRDVYLVTANNVHLDLWGVHSYMKNLTNDNAVVEVKSTVKNNDLSKKTVIVENTIIDPKTGAKLVLASRSVSIEPASEVEVIQKLNIKNPHRWNLDDPYLYLVNTKVKQKKTVIDEDTHRIGLRDITFDPNKGFALNGKGMKLKGVCIHHDAGALGAAVPVEVWRRRLEALKEIGVNAIRLSHNPQASAIYDLCDEMGLMVKDEAFDEWEFPKKKWIEGWNQGAPGLQGSAKYFNEWCERDVEDMVRRDRNHSSIILWSIGNEVDYPNDPYTHEILSENGIGQQHEAGFNTKRPHASRMGDIAKRLIKSVKNQDTNRPVTGALAGPVMSNETEYPGALDVVGYNYTENRYEMDHKKYPDRVFYGSETRHDLPAWKSARDNDYIMGQFIWTGMDYLGESGRWPSRGFTTGMVDITGFIKPRGYFRQALWSENQMAYIGAYKLWPGQDYLSMDAMPTWNFEDGDNVRIVCYTNCDEAQLVINGKEHGSRKKYDDNTAIISWDVPFTPGNVKVIAYKNGKAVDSNVINTTDAPYAIKATLLDKGKIKPGQVCHVMIEVVDKDGLKVMNADNEIICHLNGNVQLLAMDNANSSDMGDHRDRRERVTNGRLLTYVKINEPGASLKFTSNWLKPTEIVIE